MLKRSGDDTEPYCVPHMSGHGVDCSLPINTNWDCSWRKELKQHRTMLPSPKSCSKSQRIPWSIVSKALGLGMQDYSCHRSSTSATMLCPCHNWASDLSGRDLDNHIVEGSHSTRIFSSSMYVFIVLFLPFIWTWSRTLMPCAVPVNDIKWLLDEVNTQYFGERRETDTKLL